MSRRRVRVRFLAPDGRPASAATVLIQTVMRITEASAQGKGLRLTAEMVRALDYAVIRIEGELGEAVVDGFRDRPLGYGESE
jgi:hypothetical protein